MIRANERKMCECGCGTLVKKRFVSGHNMRGKKFTAEHREKLSLANRGHKPWCTGKHLSGQTKHKISLSNKGREFTEAHRNHLSKSLKGKCLRIGKKHTLATRVKMSRRKQELIKNGWQPAIKGHHHSTQTKAKISESKKALWLNADFVRRWAKAKNFKPNKPETLLLGLLNQLYPNQWKYTGDFSFVIDGRCPDFVNCNGQKKIIEVFGDYWHRGENPEDRAAIFAPFGYKTLVIWEHELLDTKSVINKIHAFMGDQ